MPTSSVGRANRAARGHAGSAGVTLLELVIVTAIAGLLVSIAFPSVSAGLETIRLRSATNATVSFLNGALNRAERREEPMEVIISPKQNTLTMYSAAPGFERTLKLPGGVSIEAVLPQLEEPQNGPRQFMLVPGGIPPRIGVQLRNGRGARRIVRVDPITGVPKVEVLDSK
jgi:prepilin-type N-terminal cleavage/methylation domain-containing protein